MLFTNKAGLYETLPAIYIERPAFNLSGPFTKLLILVFLLLFNINGQIRGQDNGREVSGKVTDQGTGVPLVNATVEVKNSATRTITDANGAFTVRVKSDQDVLVVTFSNYTSYETVVGSRSNIDIVLSSSSTAMTDVVVVAYGSQRRASVTGSVATVQGKQLTNIPVANVSGTLAGRLPGVVALQRSGQPGADNTDINIRGFGNALIIVDGVPQEFNQLDPNEIESFTVLKDASAAIYGARAANGVVLVTTKRGRTGKPVINFSVNSAWQTRTNFAEMADAGEWTSLINQGRINGGQPLKYTPYDVKVYRYVSGDQSALGEMTEAERIRFQSEDLRNYRNEDPWDAAFKNFAPMQQYNLSSRGGSEAIKYFISGGFLNQQSMLKSDDMRFRRWNLRANLDARISKNLSVNFDLGGRNENRFYPVAGLQDIMQLTYWGEPNKWKTWPDPTKPTGSIVDLSNADLTGSQKYVYTEVNAQLGFDYQISAVKGLSVQGRANYRTGFATGDIFRKEYWTYNYDFKTDVYTRATAPAQRTQLFSDSRQNVWLTGQLFLRYDRTFGKHDVKGLLLYEGLDNSLKYLGASREGYLSPSLPVLDAGGDQNKNNTGTIIEDGRASYAGRFNYAYDGKYLLEATFRYDGNSFWTGKYRWGFFPGVLAAWRISEEKFFQKGVRWIDELKLRASVGVSGDDAGGIPYQYLATYNISGRYVFNNGIVNGIRNNGLANPFATWAEYRTYNVGLDFGMLRNRLYGEIDVFYRYGYNLLGTRAAALPTTFGASLPLENINSSSNRGFEFRLGWKERSGKLFYNIEGNVSYNRARWEQVSEVDFTGVPEPIRRREQISGQWQNVMWGYRSLGIFQSQEEINKWPVVQDANGNRTLRPGDLKYEDIDGNGKIDRYDEVIIGNTVPLWMFGLNLTVEYRGFDMSMLLQGAAGFQTFINEERVPAQFEGNTYAYIANDSWTETNKDAEFPRFIAGGAQNNRQMSSFWIHDARYLRLRNIQLGYTLPGAPLKRLGLSTCRFYVSGVNLFTLSGMRMFDPEAPVGDVRYYPQQKTYSLGLNLSF